MSLHEKILRELFQDFNFYAVEPSNDSKINLSYEEITDSKGLSGPIHLSMANYMVFLGLSDNLVTAMDSLGVSLTTDKRTMAGVSAQVKESNVPNSLKALLFSHALFAQLGSEYADETPTKGADINITGLFTEGRELVHIYHQQLDALLTAQAEQDTVLTDTPDTTDKAPVHDSQPGAGGAGDVQG